MLVVATSFVCNCIHAVKSYEKLNIYIYNEGGTFMQQLWDDISNSNPGM